MVVAVVDLLDDAGKTEQAIGVVEVQVVDRWDPGPLGVVVGELPAGQHARQVAGLAAGQLHRSRVAGFHPVGEGIAEVHQRIAEGGQFPVQHADDLHRVFRVEDHVVEAVVVVHDARLVVIGRLLVLEPGLDRFPERRVGGQGLLVAVGPAGDLALHVAVRSAQVGQSAGGVVDVVQFDELVDEALAQAAGLLFVEIQLWRQFGAQDDALDPFHDVELGADHRRVGAVEVGFRAVGEACVQLVQDAVFAAHVVGRLGLVAEWRATQDELLARILDQVGQVGRATGELADLRGAFEAGDMGFQVRVDDGGVEFFAGADASGLVGQRHGVPFSWCHGGAAGAGARIRLRNDGDRR
ncbi:hypothetical protein PAERUG_P48_London_17_VIM_2_01_13_05483 [Pseudomonas aeruginosa]|nr:hypothetical protein PAERUG_P48_London_17_VIM_2_01_13_05483 [Pseudomonas aeruginosa]